MRHQSSAWLTMELWIGTTVAMSLNSSGFQYCRSPRDEHLQLIRRDGDLCLMHSIYFRPRRDRAPKVVRLLSIDERYSQGTREADLHAADLYIVKLANQRSKIKDC